MLIASIAAALLLGQAAAPSAGDTYQATKILCRPGPNSTQHTGPVCRGGGPLEAQPVCFCRGTDLKVEEPACWPDGRPAEFRRGVRPTARENDRLISCIDYERQQARRRR